MRHSLFSAAFFLAAASCAQADIVVVGHPGLGVSKLPKLEVSRVFLGISKALPDGRQVVARAVSGAVGVQFAKEVLRKTPEQLAGYWQRMTFRGMATPVQEIAPGAVKAWVASTPGAIAYMERSEVDDSVRIIALH
jgi:hypothetical protein